MILVSGIERVWRYQRQHGTWGVLRRIGAGLQRARFAGLHVLFACDLPLPSETSRLGSVERKRDIGELAADELSRIVSHWNPAVKSQQIRERLAAGAELWLARLDSTIAGYGWTMKGTTMAAHFFPLLPTEMHLFDFFVFPEFRGRNVNPTLVGQILARAGQEGVTRAHIEAAAWNSAQLSSLRKTPFRKVGAARKLSIGTWVFVLWKPQDAKSEPGRGSAGPGGSTHLTR